MCVQSNELPLLVGVATDIRECSMLSQRRSICFRHLPSHSCRTHRAGAMAQSEEMQITEGDGSNAGGTGAEAPTTSPAAKSKAKAMPKASGKRKARPRIDLDDAIAAAQQSFRQAAKCMAKARADARNEKRKKARLFKKAAQLSPMDLERIAILKRSGMWDPNLQGICEAEDMKKWKNKPATPVLAADLGHNVQQMTQRTSHQKQRHGGWKQPPPHRLQQHSRRQIKLMTRSREALILRERVTVV